MDKEKSKKTGRPTTNPRTEKLNLRISEKEKDTIQYCADKLGISRVDTIIKAIEELKIKLEG